MMPKGDLNFWEMFGLIKREVFLTEKMEVYCLKMKLMHISICGIMQIIYTDHQNIVREKRLVVLYYPMEVY